MPGRHGGAVTRGRWRRRGGGRADPTGLRNPRKAVLSLKTETYPRSGRERGAGCAHTWTMATSSDTGGGAARTTTTSPSSPGAAARACARARGWCERACGAEMEGAWGGVCVSVCVSSPGAAAHARERHGVRACGAEMEEVGRWVCVCVCVCV